MRRGQMTQPQWIDIEAPSSRKFSPVGNDRFNSEAVLDIRWDEYILDLLSKILLRKSNWLRLVESPVVNEDICTAGRPRAQSSTPLTPFFEKNHRVRLAASTSFSMV